MAVKENQPTLLVEIRTTLDALDRLPPGERWDGSNEHRAVEKDHGRIKTRRCLVSNVMSTWRAVALWPGMRSIAMVEATREIGGTVSVERRYYVTSLPPDAVRVAHAVRSHWGIENSMHWALDVAFGEDQCRVRVENAAQNFAILRRITMNLLRKDTQTKAGLKIRQLKAATSDNYRAQLLGW
ncbi:ISAs1 family transposase [Burkholderia sp. MSMB1589WGS]|uniref:ISAs1 family transposase n=1 Tax=Burkholderia sp. MSMB1589WGS TaxID=1636425 RepID=UPI0007B92F31|nr:ISAs1 family transposase [Burkholderia sp. MSMB1589WGS]